MYTTLTLLSGGYMEIVCFDPWLAPLSRHYQIRRTVDFKSICWC